MKGTYMNSHITWITFFDDSCFTIGQIHHMTTMTCASNIFKYNTHKMSNNVVKQWL